MPFSKSLFNLGGIKICLLKLSAILIILPLYFSGCSRTNDPIFLNKPLETQSYPKKQTPKYIYKIPNKPLLHSDDCQKIFGEEWEDSGAGSCRKKIKQGKLNCKSFQPKNSSNKNEILYVNYFFPNTKIKTTIADKSFATIFVKGDPEELEKLKSTGRKFPLTYEQHSKYHSITNVGQYDSFCQVPVATTFQSGDTYLVNRTMKKKIEDHKDRMIGTTIYQIQLQDGTQNIEKIDSPILSDLEKMSMTLTLKALNESAIENHFFKVGETFTDKSPITIPLMGYTMNFIQHTTYTLQKITDNNIAIIDIKSVFETSIDDTNTKDKIFKVEAYGYGELKYDTRLRYTTKESFHINMDAHITQNNLTFNVKSNEQSTTTKVIIK